MSFNLPVALTSARLIQALKDAHVPQRAVADKLSLAPSAVSMLFQGRRELKHDEALKLQELLDVDPSVIEIPLIGMAGAGNWVEAIEVARRTVWVPAASAGKFAIEIVGDSMNLAGLPEGATAIVDPEDTDLHVGKIYLLLNGDGEATVKRFRHDPARFEPVSSNPKHAPFSVGSSDFRVIGRISGAVQLF
jgi:repressor LexA